MSRLVNQALRSIERSAPLLLLGLSALYVAGTCGRASQKLFWHDELFTLYLARLPSFGDVQTALLAGADGTPPPFHALTRLCAALFGEGLTGLRLPSIVGFLVACLCLYVFVARRYGRVSGLLAAALPMATDAYVYAYEARAYGVVLGCAGVALVSWQAAAAGIRRRISVVMVLVSLAAAVSLHFFAVLLLIPIAAGELARAWTRRAPDWPLSAAIAGSVFPVALLSPWIPSASHAVAGRFSQVSARAIAEHYETIVASVAIPVLVAFVLVAVYWAIPRHLVDVDRAEDAGAPGYEWIAMVALVALPVFGGLAGAFVSGAFVARYALPWVLGFSALSACSIAALSRDARATGTIVTAVFVGWVAAKEAASTRLLTHPPPTIAASNAVLLARANGDGGPPIAVTHGHTFLPLSEYGPPGMAARLVKLVQPARLDAELGGPNPEPGLHALATWMPLKIVDFDAFTCQHHHFLLYGPPTWVLDELRAAGAHLELKGVDMATAPFAMSVPGPLLLHEVTFTQSSAPEAVRQGRPAIALEACRSVETS